MTQELVKWYASGEMVYGLCCHCFMQACRCHYP